MLGAGQHQGRVDLVADDAGAVAYDDVADAFQLGAREDPTPRVVGLGQDQRPRPLGEEPVEPVEVDLGAGGRGGHGEEVLRPAGDAGQAVLGVVAGCREDHSPRIAEDVEGDPHPGRHVDDGADGPGLGRPAEVPPRPAGVRLSQRRILVERVARHPVRERPLDRLQHHRVDGVVHLGDPRGNHVLRHGAPLEDQGPPCLLVGEVDDRAPLPRGVLHARLRPARAKRPQPRPARSPRPAVRRCPGGRRGSGRTPRPSRRRRHRRSA